MSKSAGQKRKNHFQQLTAAGPPVGQNENKKEKYIIKNKHYNFQEPKVVIIKLKELIKIKLNEKHWWSALDQW